MSDSINDLTEKQQYEMFDEYLDMIHNEKVTICGYDYSPSMALKEVDPIAYEEEFSNWLDSMLTEEEA